MECCGEKRLEQILEQGKYRWRGHYHDVEERLAKLPPEKRAKYEALEKELDYIGAAELLYPTPRLVPAGLNLKEKMYFWIGETAACMVLPSLMWAAYAIGKGEGELAASVFCANAVLMFGGFTLMSYSSKQRRNTQGSVV